VTLDSTGVEDGLGLFVVSLLSQGLVGGGEKGDWEYQLAETHEVLGEGRIWRFKLKKGLFWSDGAPLLPVHFVDAFYRILDPKLASKNAEQFFEIKNAKNYFLKKVNKIGVKADESWITFYLEKPRMDWISILTHIAARPIRKDYLKDEKWNPYTPTVGAYFIKKYEFGVMMKLAPNPYFWGTQARYPVHIQIVKESAAAIRLFEQGRLDYLPRIPEDELGSIHSKYVHSFPYSATYYLGFNTRKPPFDQRSVRCAFSQAVKKKKAIQAAGVLSKPTDQFLLPMYGNQKSKKRKESSIQIKKIIQVGVNSGSRDEIILQSVLHDWKKNGECRLS
tara:strand:- start:1448 stop:2449 length:1002 start_codon:yes stop_codon:yes gene_type:complete